MAANPARWIAISVLVVSQTSQATDSSLLAPVEAEIRAINNKDPESAGACWADNGVVVLRPDLPFGGERIIDGRAEITQWFRDLVAMGFRMEARLQPLAGNKVRAEAKTWTWITEKMGIAPLIGTAEYSVEGGKITHLLYVQAPESVQRFESARNRFVAVAAVILTACVAVIWWGVRRIRRGRLGSHSHA